MKCRRMEGCKLTSRSTVVGHGSVGDPRGGAKLVSTLGAARRREAPRPWPRITITAAVELESFVGEASLGIRTHIGCRRREGRLRSYTI